MRRVKRFCAAATMALAVAAFPGAGFASAEMVPIGVGILTPQFEAESSDYPVTIVGEPIEEAQAEWDIRAHTAKCDVDSYDSYLLAATPYLHVVPSYTNCTYANLPTTVELNGCSYQIEMVSEVAGTEEVICPGGETIEVLIYGSESAQESGDEICKADIARQGPLDSVGFSGGGIFGAIAVSSSLTGLEYTFTRNSIFCPEGEGEFEDGTYEDNVRITGTTE